MNYQLIASRLQCDLRNRLSTQPLKVARPIMPQLQVICSAAAMRAQSEASLEAPSPVVVDKMIHDLQRVTRPSLLLLRLAEFYSTQHNGMSTAQRFAAAIPPELLASPKQQIFTLLLQADQISIETAIEHIRLIYRSSHLHHDLHAHFGEKLSLNTRVTKDWLKLLEADATAGRQTAQYAIKYSVALAVHRRFSEASKAIATTLRENPSNLSILADLLLEELVQNEGPRWDLYVARACLGPVQPFLDSVDLPLACAWRIQVALNHYCAAWEIIRQMDTTKTETLATALHSVVQFWIYEQPDWAQQALKWIQSSNLESGIRSLLLPRALAHACAGCRKMAAGLLDAYLKAISGTIPEINRIEDRRLYWIAIVQALLERSQDALQSFQAWRIESTAKARFEPLLQRALKENAA
jgi:hypothetical protein